MYLFYGESFRLIEEEIEKIIKGNNNVLTMDLSVSTLQDVIEEATYVSMFQEQKYIIVRNANFFTSNKSKEEDIELFLKYIKNPIPLTTIIFTCSSKVDARKKVYKEFSQKYPVKATDLVNKFDLINKVRDMVFQNKFKIETETIEYILTTCQNNFDLIFNELQKIFLYYETPKKIEKADVYEIISKTLMDNNFKFLDAVVKKDSQLALKILEDLYILKVEPISLLMLLAREYRLMYSVEFLLRNGYRKADIGKKLGLQDWQINKAITNANYYYEEDLKNILKELSNIDYHIKSGQKDRFLELKTLLLKIWE